MKKFALGMAFGILLGGVLVALAGEVFYQGKNVVVIVEQENLRKSPNGEKFATLDKGAPLVVLADGEKWLKVATSGYIWKESVSGERQRLAGKPMRASMIVVHTEAEAKTILQQAKSGVDFASLAKKHSIDAATAKRGGDLGEFYKGDFSPEIEAPILKLKPNEISDVVKLKIGYAIFKRTQ